MDVQKRNILTTALILVFGGCLTLSLGCNDKMGSLVNQVRKANETNVAKVRTCFNLYASRNDQRGPDSQEELIEFLRGSSVEKNLKRLAIAPADLEKIFISERDGQPIKVKWGGKVNVDNPRPVAFESVGIDGVRLVAAVEVMEVDSEERYQELWEGKNFKSSIVNSGDDLE